MFFSTGCGHAIGNKTWRYLNFSTSVKYCNKCIFLKTNGQITAVLILRSEYIFLKNQETIYNNLLLSYNINNDICQNV